MRKQNRSVADFFSLLFMKLYYYFSAILPLGVQNFLGDLSGRLAYHFASQKREVALDSLKQAYPEKSQTWREKIAIESFQIMAGESFKVFSFILRPHLVEQRVKVTGEDNLRQALAKKRGVVAVSAHFGNFPLMSLKLAQCGYKIGVMARPMRYKKVGEFVQYLREKSGVYTIDSLPRQQAVYKTLRFLRENGIIIMQMDQNFGTGGVWVNFFGRLAATPIGPIVFALRSQAPLLPMFIIGRGGYYEVHIEPEIELIISSDKDKTILDNAIKITHMIEAWIRRYPQSWSWIHRRWKTPPPPYLQQKFKVQKV